MVLVPKLPPIAYVLRHRRTKSGRIIRLRMPIVGHRILPHLLLYLRVSVATPAVAAATCPAATHAAAARAALLRRDVHGRPLRVRGARVLPRPQLRRVRKGRVPHPRRRVRLVVRRRSPSSRGAAVDGVGRGRQLRGGVRGAQQRPRMRRLLHPGRRALGLAARLRRGGRRPLCRDARVPNVHLVHGNPIKRRVLRAALDLVGLLLDTECRLWQRLHRRVQQLGAGGWQAALLLRRARVQRGRFQFPAVATADATADSSAPAPSITPSTPIFASTSATAASPAAAAASAATIVRCRQPNPCTGCACESHVRNLTTFATCLLSITVRLPRLRRAS